MIDRIKDVIEKSDVIVITAGAGMGVDSGLPDFRSNGGFWNNEMAYEQIANPKWFRTDYKKIWDFYSYRLDLYRKTIPHQGFNKLLDICKTKDYFVFTSNVDGQFQKSGFDENKIVECHGSIHYLQCIDDCKNDIWFNNQNDIPFCPDCGEVTRPNILMFGDWEWNSHRTDEQEKRFNKWLGDNYSKKICIIEIGAGTSIPTVRSRSEHILECYAADLIRINLTETDGPWFKEDRFIPVKMKALEILKQL